MRVEGGSAPHNSDGTRAGGEFVINTNTDSDQSSASVTALDGGGFVVVWQSATGDGSGYGIYGQRYDNSGVKVGSEFLINSNTGGNQYDPQVSALHGANAGAFVVTWHGDASYQDVFARVFDARGAGTPTPVGSDLAVNVQRPALNGNNYDETCRKSPGLRTATSSSSGRTATATGTERASSASATPSTFRAEPCPGSPVTTPTARRPPTTSWSIV